MDSENNVYFGSKNSLGYIIFKYTNKFNSTTNITEL